MTYGYKTLEDGTVVPYPIDTQLPKKTETVVLSEIPAYCLSHYRDRRTNIADACAELGMNVVFINSDTDQYTHQRNVAYDLMELIIIAISHNNYPFLILEDDATLIDCIPNSINIPKDTDLIYWGSNRVSGPPVLSNKLYLENYSNDYYRLYNSQSGHAILVPNKKSTLFLKDIILQSLIHNEFHDVLLPNISSSKIFLTPKDGPYFYQNDGRNEGITNFKWKTSGIPIK